MRTLSARFGVALGFLALGLLPVGSCSHHEDPDPDRDRVLRDTPENAIACFAIALEEKAIDDYCYCLEAGYRFIFLPVDYSDAGVTPQAPYWGKTEDVEATGHMLSSPHVLSITCDLPVASEVSRSDSLVTLVCGVDLQVAVDDGGSEPSTYWVSSTSLVFTLVPDDLSQDLWVIRDIEETFDAQALTRLGGAIRAVEHHTFGFIKAMLK